MRMREIIRIVENTTPGVPPEWFVNGRPLTPKDLDALDASEFIEDTEWDHEWRLCDVPISLLPNPQFNMADPDDRERIESIDGWFSQAGVGAALDQRPIVALFTSRNVIKVLDGFHRIAVARKLGVSTVRAAVGFGDPYNGLDD